MARKNKRGKSTTAAVSVDADRAVVTAVSPERRPAVSSSPKKPAAERTWLETWWMKTARWIGSLQLAVIFLSLLVVVLGVGTALESWYSAKIAQELVYRVWWFSLLLALIAANIFFAAVKKWPWKKHQTGFLITHLGLLTLLAGGILNSLGGTDSMMTLIDTNQPALQKENGLPQASSTVAISDTQVIRVRKGGAKGEEPKEVSYPITPGSLAWRSDQNLNKRWDFPLSVLDWLSHPLPRRWHADLEGARLEVLNYYPHVRQVPYSEADEERQSFPALQYELTNPMLGSLPAQWLGLDPAEPNNAIRDVFGTGLVELLGRCPAPLLGEFLKPPASSDVGAKGHLVLHVDGRSYRFPVAENLDRTLPLGASGWKLKLTRYSPLMRMASSNESRPLDPGVEFDLIAPDGKSTSYRQTARAVVDSGPMKLPPGHVPVQHEARPAAWYHPPDYRYGRDNLRGVLQFVQDDQGKIHYRSFSSKTGPFQIEKSGPVEPATQHDIWSGMNWKFQVKEHIPQAITKLRYVPSNERPGLERRQDLFAALRCKLTAGQETKEVWLPHVGLGGQAWRTVKIAGREYSLEFGELAKDLGFQVKLLRAETTFDPGTRQAASYTSYVQLTDTARGIQGEDRVITMNEPTVHKGYKFFQTNIGTLTVDQNDRPVSYSGFTVSRDPGLWLKYAGSTMLALGIVCMFYMKAYFFKPRGRPGM